MTPIDRRAFFASLLGAAVTAGVAAKIPGLNEAIGKGVLTEIWSDDAYVYLRFARPDGTESGTILSPNSGFITDGVLLTQSSRVTVRRVGTAWRVIDDSSPA